MVLSGKDALKLQIDNVQKEYQQISHLPLGGSVRSLKRDKKFSYLTVPLGQASHEAGLKPVSTSSRLMSKEGAKVNGLIQARTMV